MAEIKSDLKAVYLIHSAHQLLLNDALERLISGIGGKDAEALDLRRFNAGDADADEIIAASQALSFLGGRRLVVVSDILSLDDSGQKVLAAYTNDPNPQTVLVLTAVAGGKQEQKRLKASVAYKACVSALGASVHEYEIKSGLPGWVKSAFAARRKRIGVAAIDYIITWVGADLSRLKTEIEKISNAADDEEISLDLVREVAVVANEAEVFDLVSDVIGHDTETALARLAPLLDKDSTGGHIFGLLDRQFQLILAAKTKGRGLSGQKLAAALGVSPGQAYYLERQSRAFSFESIKKALGLLVDVDFKRKSSPIPIRLLLEMLIVDLTERVT